MAESFKVLLSGMYSGFLRPTPRIEGSFMMHVDGQTAKIDAQIGRDVRRHVDYFARRLNNIYTGKESRSSEALESQFDLMILGVQDEVMINTKNRNVKLKARDSRSVAAHVALIVPSSVLTSLPDVKPVLMMAARRSIIESASRCDKEFGQKLDMEAVRALSRKVFSGEATPEELRQFVNDPQLEAGPES